MPPERVSTAAGRRGLVLFWLIVAALLVVRVPVMYREPGEMDEECYATPGLFVLRDGVPRLPHIRSRDAGSVFYHADTVLFAEPPLSFYLQAVFFAALPPVYGTARLLSVCAGIAVLGLIWTLTRKWFGGLAAAAWATGLFSVSRWFFLQAIRARPDMLCTAFGLAAIWAVCQWRESGQTLSECAAPPHPDPFPPKGGGNSESPRRLRWLVLAGLFVGLGGMTHPFAVVYAAQIGLWVMIDARGWSRLLQPALVAVVALLVTGLWLPLILSYPEIFRIQFHNQFLTPHDPPAARLLTPWKPVLYHAGMMWHQIKPWQFLLAAAPLTACTVHACRGGSWNARIAVALAWSSICLMGLCVGIQHPVPGYWTYPASLMFICTGWLIQQATSRLEQAGRAGRCLAWTCGMALVLAMLPQSRVGTWVVHLRNWNDVNYNAPRFARQVMSEIPPEAVCATHAEFLLDFLAADRPVILAGADTGSPQALPIRWDYFVGSRITRENQQMVDTTQARLLHTWGDIENLYACYAEVYRRADRPTESP